MSPIISTQSLSESLDNDNLVIVDCRFDLLNPEKGRLAYLSAHIPGAIYAHLDEALSAPISSSSGRHPLPDVATFLYQLGQWGIGNDSDVVVYDDLSGAIAGRLWWMLRWLGHDRVRLLDGGFKKWDRENHPLTMGNEDNTPKAFQVMENKQAWLTTSVVQERLNNGEIVLIDARAAGRYHGEMEPIDNRAGHVPGAINRPLQDNLDSDGCFRQPDGLQQDFSKLLSQVRGKPVVHMCGSGVSACHNMIAMEIAGMGNSMLYVGSWSEWIRDPDRPTSP